MSDIIIIMPSAQVDWLRRKAKQIRKETGVPHHEALDIVAREFGHLSDWHHVIESAKVTEPAERAHKTGLVIGMDVKEADDVNVSRLTHFVVDEQLYFFVLREYGKEGPVSWDDEDEEARQIAHEFVFFRSKRLVPDTLDQAVAIAEKDFFFAPRYLRLKGERLIDPFEFGDEDEGGENG